MKTCKNCGLTEKMYWCEACQTNSEIPECADCDSGKDLILDKEYHDNCPSMDDNEPIQEKDIIRDTNGDEVEQ